MKAYQLDWSAGPFFGDIVFYPYQVAIGLTARVFEGVASVRLHVGSFKLWAGFMLPGSADND